MPTETTHAADASSEAHQSATEAQNATAHSEAKTFDARRAFDATNERLNKVAAVVEKIDPEVITQIADKLGVTKKEAEKQVNDSPDVQQIVQTQLWLDKHSDRIADANKDGKYDHYRNEGLRPELALRLAEQDSGIKIDTSEQRRQQKASTADAPLDRSVSPEMPESLKGIMTPEDFKKYAAKAKKVQIIR